LWKVSSEALSRNSIFLRHPCFLCRKQGCRRCIEVFGKGFGENLISNGLSVQLRGGPKEAIESSFPAINRRATIGASILDAGSLKLRK
jgi:hypothetical protein